MHYQKSEKKKCIIEIVVSPDKPGNDELFIRMGTSLKMSCSIHVIWKKTDIILIVITTAAMINNVVIDV